MSQDVGELAVPVGLNWNEQSAGSATTGDLCVLLRRVERRVGRRGQQLEQREVGERGDQAAAEDDRLAADPVRQRAEDTKPPVPRISDQAISTLAVN